MKLADCERHLRKYGCELFRQGGGHAIWWNPVNRKTSALPRHREVKDFTFRGVCRQLEIPAPGSEIF